jgi:hypothetical protein
MLELSATLFRPGYMPEAIQVEIERDRNTVVNPGLLTRLLDRLW